MTRREIIIKCGLAMTGMAFSSPLTAFSKYSYMTHKSEYEVIIIGGSYAGLSAAMALGRSLRRVLIIDGGKPCNAQTPHSHNFITQDGKTPREISTLARQQVEAYKTITFYEGVAVSGSKTDNSFEITTGRNDKFTAEKLIFATGIKDIMPSIAGFKECWGISVIHCPYCHGYEVRRQPTGIFANGARAFHLASLVRNLTDVVTVLTNGEADFDKEQMDKLKRNNVRVIESPVAALEHDGGKISRVVFGDGTSQNLKALYASLPFEQNSDIPKSLGCEFTEMGYLKVDQFQETNVSGVFACGDNSNMMRSLANAVYTGNFAGAMVNAKLVEKHF